ncbi:MAG: hypothetical protein OXM58_20690 [Rhodospirillaceae bacterium]|nr:hypothetical protein [Rhodospirillaceae bacterium]MDE0618015.1 hypothetical protein [Rhodospirillaceae bacterium]
MTGPSDIEGSDILLTVFLKHDQSKTLGEFQATLDARDWWRRFPPEGVEIVSWTVAMGLGQIVTLRLPPDRLQAVNVELERSAWGVFRTEMFVSYDFLKVRDRLARESAARGDGSEAVEAPATASETAAGAPVPSGAGGGDHPRLPHNGLSIEPRQFGKAPPTGYEDRLSAALEAAFAAGIHDLPAVAAALNEAGLKTPDGETWTEANFPAAMQRLGDPAQSGMSGSGAAGAG